MCPEMPDEVSLAHLLIHLVKQVDFQVNEQATLLTIIHIRRHPQLGQAPPVKEVSQDCDGWFRRGWSIHGCRLVDLPYFPFKVRLRSSCFGSSGL